MMHIIRTFMTRRKKIYHINVNDNNEKIKLALCMKKKSLVLFLKW